ncbi:enoyl-CoA hydratase/isomerase family protein [Candidatus Uabimicrobium amorphum]|uniref:Enoyl-CoA hydratase n=1 Tax=Uabimicrobium amorphum TaxID=2596890 RepID=A0A5S9IJ18_UABAM|nr:enoyl-CoA hydratase-related protein [Candidatus Uabimicrobium amorphum]BBM82431.1 enoyl-CoA hydratase [Candidatus Uabimicrobium amorphum]
MSKQVVKIEKQGDILEIILNRPSCYNAMNFDLFDGVMEGVEQAKNPGIRAVIIRGEGKFFCVGGDIKEFSKAIETGRGLLVEDPERLHKIMSGIRSLPKPVIAVVHGACAGAGFSLMLCCDLAIAAKSTRFIMAYTSIGASADGGSTYFLPRHVGVKKAMELFVTQDLLTAKKAQKLGLINYVVPKRKLIPKAHEMAQKLASGPTLAYAKVKELLNHTYDNNLGQQLDLEAQFFVDSTNTEDFRGAVDAFLNKKKPLFRGK